MENSAIIGWNPANWITVILMVTGFFLLVGMSARIVQQKRANAPAA
jgi:hypothetical protein